jgi:hypothetical protein
MTVDVRRLTFSKYLLGRAKSLHQEGKDLASAMAVLAAHDSSEMLMKVVLDSIGAAPAKTDKVYFMDFWQLVKDKRNDDPPYKTRMTRLNSARVAFKHKGILPNPREVSEMMTDVSAFCEEVTQKYLQLNYRDVSLADLIPNFEARDKVKEAEKAAEAGDNETALLAIGIAFDKLFKEAGEKHGLGLIKQSDWDRLDHVHAGERYDRELASAVSLDKVRKPLQQLIDTVNFILLGIEPARFRRFSEITPIRLWVKSGKLYHRLRRPPDRVPKKDLDFCIEFVIDFGLRLITMS